VNLNKDESVNEIRQGCPEKKPELSIVSSELVSGFYPGSSCAIVTVKAFKGITFDYKCGCPAVLVFKTDAGQITAHAQEKGAVENVCGFKMLCGQTYSPPFVVDFVGEMG